MLVYMTLAVIEFLFATLYFADIYGRLEEFEPQGILQ
jgi:hypothetical protein